MELCWSLLFWASTWHAVTGAERSSDRREGEWFLRGRYAVRDDTVPNMDRSESVLSNAVKAELLSLNRCGTSQRADRQLQIKRTAGEAGFIMPAAFHPNSTAMRPRYSPHNGQPQARAAALESRFA